jgi:glucose/arabinose dehydrogenase
MRSILNRRRTETAIAAVLAIAAAAIGISERDEDRPGRKFLTLDRIGRFDQPVHMAQPPGSDLLFVVEQPGRVRVVRDGQALKRPFVDLRRAVQDKGHGGEQGMLSMAFAPDYQDSGLAYLSYTDRRGSLRIVEYGHQPGDETRADKDSGRLVMKIGMPSPQHHGGLLAFGPDKYLYIGVGDGGPNGDARSTAQNKRILLGKLLRIDPLTRPALIGGGRRAKDRPTEYTVPSDNPYVGRPGRDEIYSYGLRNPWRFSFDRARGLIAIGDVGDGRYEEVSILPLRKARGANFGWPGWEGNYEHQPGAIPRGRTIRPALAYPHGPGCAVTGGYVVRDPRLSRIAGREIVGRYLFGDFCTGRVFGFRYAPNGRGKERSFRFRVPALSSFAEDRSGRIYLISQNGPIYRLDPARKRS